MPGPQAGIFLRQARLSAGSTPQQVLDKCTNISIYQQDFMKLQRLDGYQCNKTARPLRAVIFPVSRALRGVLDAASAWAADRV
jgi:hypothetical protein